MRKIISLVLALFLVLFVGCSAPAASSAAPAPSSVPAPSSAAPAPSSEPAKEPVKLLVAAAASLEYSLKDQIIPLFQKQYPWITVEGSYDSSGKLQTQIEEGLGADIFLSAANKQMKALTEKKLMKAESVIPLLENKIVLITAADSKLGLAAFEDIAKAKTIALGDPESVPVGQYAKEALTSLKLWDAIQKKVSFGTNVTEVLNWVAEGSADAGIVYATDAATTPKVKVIAQAPKGSLAKPVIYPAGMVAATKNPEAAQLFLDFLTTPEALKIFADYGFAAAPAPGK